MSDYIEGSRERMPHPTDKIQVGVVVQNLRTKAQHKVKEVDPMTRQFSRVGGHRTEWYSYEDFIVLDGQEEALDADNPDVAINDLARQMAEAQAAKERHEAAKAAAAQAQHSSGTRRK